MKYGLKNSAYDFAYSKQKGFMLIGWGHLDLFLWGLISGAYQGINWSINGAIKKKYKGIKINGSQGNKLGLNYYKWILEMINLSNL